MGSSIGQNLFYILLIVGGIFVLSKLDLSRKQERPPTTTTIQAPVPTPSTPSPSPLPSPVNTVKCQQYATNNRLGSGIPCSQVCGQEGNASACADCETVCGQKYCGTYGTGPGCLKPGPPSAPTNTAVCQSEGGVWQNSCCSCPNKTCKNKCTGAINRDPCAGLTGYSGCTCRGIAQTNCNPSTGRARYARAYATIVENYGHMPITPSGVLIDPGEIYIPRQYIQDMQQYRLKNPVSAGHDVAIIKKGNFAREDDLTRNSLPLILLPPVIVPRERSMSRMITVA